MALGLVRESYTNAYRPNGPAGIGYQLHDYDSTDGMSDYYYTDLDGDMVPEGPVVRMPARTNQEAANISQSCMLHNAGVTISPYGKVLFIVDDLGDAYVQEVDRLMDDVASSGLVARGPLASSNYSTHAQARAAAKSMMDEGCVNLGRGV